MIIDIIYLIILAIAAVTGYRRGLIVSVFSLVALLFGLAAALKLSALTASYIGSSVKVSEEWLPVISFLIVFLLAYLLVRWAGRLIEKAVQLVQLGWLNRLGGIIFFIVLYTTIYSVLLFYAYQTGVIKRETKNKSFACSFIEPWGPKAINGLGTALPVFKNMFSDLENFFGKLPEELPEQGYK